MLVWQRQEVQALPRRVARKERPVQPTEALSVQGQELVRKLGIKPGHFVAVLNAPPFMKGIFRMLVPPETRFETDLDDNDHPDIVLFWLDESINLPSAFKDLRDRITPDGAVWAVIPKKPVAITRGPKIYFDDVLAQVLPTGLVDNKTVTFTDDEYGIRFVLRKELRKLPPWERPASAP